ncbi:C2H2-type zinc finger protein [Methanolobus bombayensis]|uniref:C2H2-type zinc finger protein n=1 Tax=Methanolobus bombayensis TaxID=38023 RepID=UPI001AE3586C|nr:C2H2-type zinc finger protein [Methanolobus bombayensis]MBP1909182.1 hypothetical protein [Methanolobus bombayensis]
MRKCKCGTQLDSREYCHHCQQYMVSYKNKTDFKKRCSICNKLFRDLSNYMDHLKNHPQCDYCQERFFSEDALKKHLESNHTCPICNEYYCSVSKHLVMAHPYCEFCDKRFLNRDIFKEHMKDHPKCEYCGNNFQDKIHLDSHILEKHHCHVCNQYICNVEEHIREQHPFCNLCDQYFFDAKSYEQHNQQKHTHQCTYCDKIFKLKASLENHISNSHKCSYCNKYFSELKQHFIDEHFYCERCKKPFFNANDYKKDQSFHNMVTYKFVAPSKGRKQSKNTSRKIFGGKIECQFCLKTFASENEKDEHIKAFHSKRKKR